MSIPVLSRRQALITILAGSGSLALAGCGGLLRTGAPAGRKPSGAEATMCIESAIARFAQAVDGGDPEAFAALFLPGGGWQPGPGADAAPVVGQDAIRAWHASATTRRPATVRLCRHQVLGPVITVSGDRASFRAWLQRDWYRTDLDQVRTAAGLLAGEMERLGDAWRFARLVRTCAYAHGSGPVRLLHNGRQRLAGG
jgi:hypothetical protein